MRFALLLAILQVACAADSLWQLEWNSLPEFQKGATIGNRDEFQVTWLDQTTIAIAAIYRSATDLKAGPAFRDAVRSNVVVAAIDATSGQVRSSKAWRDLRGASALWNALTLLPSGDGGAFVAAVNQIARLSPRFQQAALRTLNPPERNTYPTYDRWGVNYSPGTPKLLLISVANNRYQLHWPRALDLQDQKVTTPPPEFFNPTSLVGDSIVFIPRMALDPAEVLEAVQTRKRMSSPHARVLLHGETRDLCELCAGSVSEAFGEGLVMMGVQPDGSYLIVDVTGKIRHQGRYADATLWQARGSSQANRVAIFWHENITLGAGSSATQIAVVDADQRSEVLRTEIRSNAMRPAKGIVQFQSPRIALSPDGTRLAIVTGETLRLIAIP